MAVRENCFRVKYLIDGQTHENSIWAKDRTDAVKKLKAEQPDAKVKNVRQLTRTLTRKELKRWEREAAELHSISWEFDKKFQKNLKPPRKKKDWLKVGKKTIKHYDKWVWRWTGYDLMKRIEKWAERHKTVRICGCDDDYFCGSRLVIIPHERKRHYMGATVVYVPQCTGEQPIKFFLYPDHVNRLVPALMELQRKALKKKS